MSRKWTEEEIAEMGRKHKVVHDAIVAKIGPYKRGETWGSKGTMTCPLCETGTLHYFRTAYNGHMGAQCTTPGCTNWRT